MKMNSTQEAHEVLNLLEAKWLKDRRINELATPDVKLQAAKVAAVIDFYEQNSVDTEFYAWVEHGAKGWARYDQKELKDRISDLQMVRVLDRCWRIKVSDEEATPYDRFMDLHDQIGELLRKRRQHNQSIDPRDFPKSDEEYATWELFTDPSNLEIFDLLDEQCPPTNKDSRKLWQKALAECRAKSKSLASVH